MGPLSARFVALFRDELETAWACALVPRLEAAERATPLVKLPVDGFLAGLVTTLRAAPEELSRLHVEDMYLVWALGGHDRAAFERFEREFLGSLAQQVSGARELPRGELEQQVRTRLFVPNAGEAPRISQYSGRGPFGAWLRMVGKRVALDLLRARGVSGGRELESPVVATDPELDYLKLRYAGDFKQALEHALAQLDARQVTLLKLSYLEQLSPAAIGLMYGVSARTVQRWLEAIRETLLSATRAELKARLALTPTELDSLLGLLQSRLHVSLHRVLGLAEPSPR